MNEVSYAIQDEHDEATHPFSNLNAEIENQSIIDFNNDYVKSSTCTICMLIYIKFKKIKIRKKEKYL